MEPRIVIAMYSPHEGKEQQLMDLVRKHLPTLQKLELATNRDPIICKSENGSILEIFEWSNENSSSKAHEHPEVAKIWEQMGEVADFSTLGKLPESAATFPHFMPL